MRSGGDSADGVSKTRPVLGDVTNRLGKRGLSQISGDLRSKFGDGHGKNVEDKEGDSQFTQKVSQGVENIVKEKCGIKCCVNNNEQGKRSCVSPRPCSEINSLRGNVISSISKVSSEANVVTSTLKIPSEAKEPNSLDGSLHLGRSNDTSVEVAGAARDSFVSGISLPIDSRICVDVEGNCDNTEGRVTFEVMRSDSQGEELGAHECRKDCIDIGADRIVSVKDDVECSKLPESQCSDPFKLEKCIELKGDGNSNSNADVEFIKACSCSFCIKAAYIWSDLYYQDIKGRIAALKKSQKEANDMVQRSCKDKGVGKVGQGNCHNSSKLESDLVAQWKSLFRHMEDILVREGSQLEENLVALKDLRDSCKADLEMINGKASEKQ